ncbi:hypothetical protein TWF281_002430 [Arthrobotrys megalospora]
MSQQVTFTNNTIGIATDSNTTSVTFQGQLPYVAPVSNQVAQSFSATTVTVTFGTGSGPKVYTYAGASNITFSANSTLSLTGPGTPNVITVKNLDHPNQVATFTI